eukprot:GHRR01028310.1.p1 GENE.GHRR01028310.1~~GHRR01028310.1.p1  ORF type:complete len:468 (+),score=135.13 GHRR01028310.1:72-1475(+)
MMAIPRAYAHIGSLTGTIMLVGVGFLTYFTLAVLVRGSAVTGAPTYTQLAHVTCGKFSAKVLQLAILAFCFGFGVVYLVIIRDILAGTPPACSGLLCEVFGLNPSSTWTDPRLVCVAIAVVVCAPLLLLRSLDKLAPLNIVGVIAIALLASVAAALGLQATAHGTAYPIPLLPQWKLLGPTKAQQFEALTAVLPVIVACYIAHQNIHPAMQLLKPYSYRRMCGVMAVALAMSFGVFATLAVGSCLAFGPTLQVNVLNNFSVSGLEQFVHHSLACTLSWSIRGGFLIALLANLLLYMHPLRGCLAEMIWAGENPHHTDQTAVPTTSSRSAHSSHAGHTNTASSSNAAVSDLPPRVTSSSQQPGITSTRQQQTHQSPFVTAAGSQMDPADAESIIAGKEAAAMVDEDRMVNVAGDGSKPLVAFDSMDSPRFGSWTQQRLLCWLREISRLKVRLGKRSLDGIVRVWRSRR